jgi:hypothetical protein
MRQFQGEGMLRASLRTIAGVLIGLVVAFALVNAVELFGSMVHPLPEDFENTMDEMCRHVERYPQWVLAVVVAAWAVAALVSTSTAQYIGNLYSAAIVGLILLAALVVNISMLPYPIWFKIANLIMIPTAMLVGIRWSIRRKTAGTGRVNMDQ